MNNELVQTGFFDVEEVRTESLDCYIGLPEEDITYLEQCAFEINAFVVYASVEIGRRLANARDKYRHNKHGGFEKWLERRVKGMSLSTAYNHISSHDAFGNLPNFGRLDIADSAQYLLAKRSTPQAARDEAIRRAESGEKITYTASKEIIEEAQRKIEELQEENQELQGQLNLVEEDRERERKENEWRVSALNNEIVDLENKALIHEQAKTIMDQQMKSNAEEIAHLLEELAKQPESEKIEVDKFVTPPEVEANIKKMKDRITALEDENNKLLDSSSAKATAIEGLTQERDDLAKEKEGLVKLANKNLFAETQIKYMEEVKDANRKMSSIFDKGLRETRALMPNAIDTKQAYGGDEWARIEWMRSQAMRFIEELDRLKESIQSQFVDASAMDSANAIRFIESPMAFIEAG